MVGDPSRDEREIYAMHMAQKRSGGGAATNRDSERLRATPCGGLTWRNIKPKDCTMTKTDFNSLYGGKYLAAGEIEGDGFVGTALLRPMFEVARLNFRATGPALAAAALLRIATTDGHKDQARAAIAVMDRAGMGPLQNIHVEHHHTMG
jgi:hypothetical protein